MTPWTTMQLGVLVFVVGLGPTRLAAQPAEGPRRVMDHREVKVPDRLDQMGFGDWERLFRGQGASGAVPAKLKPICDPRPNSPVDGPEPWRRRDPGWVIAQSAKHGRLRVRLLYPGTSDHLDWASPGAGWRVYALALPPGRSAELSLQHPEQGALRLVRLDQTGRVMASAAEDAPQHLRLLNPASAWQVAYVMVDDPGQRSSSASPYRLLLNPVQFHAPPTGLEGAIAGIWAY